MSLGAPLPRGVVVASDVFGAQHVQLRIGFLDWSQKGAVVERGGARGRAYSFVEFLASFGG